MAIDYFQSSKYHEALILFQQLEKQYKLNPRHLGYLGVCYYYEWEYNLACKYLDQVLPQLEVFAPHERSIYYFTDAESHFYLEQYEQAIPLYEQMLNVCFDNEKADAFYRIGFCYLFQERWMEASTYFEEALTYYQRYPQIASQTSRQEQLKTMIKGLQYKIKSGTEFAQPSVTTQ